MFLHRSSMIEPQGFENRTDTFSQIQIAPKWLQEGRDDWDRSMRRERRSTEKSCNGVHELLCTETLLNERAQLTVPRSSKRNAESGETGEHKPRIAQHTSRRRERTVEHNQPDAIGSKLPETIGQTHKLLGEQKNNFWSFRVYWYKSFVTSLISFSLSISNCFWLFCSLVSFILIISVSLFLSF